MALRAAVGVLRRANCGVLQPAGLGPCPGVQAARDVSKMARNWYGQSNSILCHLSRYTLPAAEYHKCLSLHLCVDMLRGVRGTLLRHRPAGDDPASAPSGMV